MRELVETITMAIVDQPDKVQINEIQSEKSVILEISVADDDMGKVIGRQGRIARAIRTVVKAAATKEGKKVVVSILEN